MKKFIPILLCLQACASIVTGSQQSLSIDTPAVSAASCSLVNDKGTWYVSTPGTVSVHRSYGALNVNCKKEGYQPAVASINSNVKGMAFGNILAGGIVGGAIDAGTGAAYDYPPLITVQMSKNKP